MRIWCKISTCMRIQTHTYSVGQEQVCSCEYPKHSLFFIYYSLISVFFPIWATVELFLPCPAFPDFVVCRIAMGVDLNKDWESNALWVKINTALHAFSLRLYGVYHAAANTCCLAWSLSASPAGKSLNSGAGLPGWKPSRVAGQLCNPEQLALVPQLLHL